MEVNTLVLHKKKTNLGIGCISKVMKSSYRVNFGTDDVMTCKAESLNEIDTSHCKTIEWGTVRALSIANSKNLPQFLIIGNELKHWVGIGWVTHRVITLEDLKKYARVV